MIKHKLILLLVEILFFSQLFYSTLFEQKIDDLAKKTDNPFISLYSIRRQLYNYSSLDHKPTYLSTAYAYQELYQQQLFLRSSYENLARKKQTLTRILVLYNLYSKIDPNHCAADSEKAFIESDFSREDLDLIREGIDKGVEIISLTKMTIPLGVALEIVSTVNAIFVSNYFAENLKELTLEHRKSILKYLEKTYQTFSYAVKDYEKAKQEMVFSLGNESKYYIATGAEESIKRTESFFVKLKASADLGTDPLQDDKGYKYYLGNGCKEIPSIVWKDYDITEELIYLHETGFPTIYASTEKYKETLKTYTKQLTSLEEEYAYLKTVLDDQLSNAVKEGLTEVTLPIEDEIIIPGFESAKLTVKNSVKKSIDEAKEIAPNKNKAQEGWLIESISSYSSANQKIKRILENLKLSRKKTIEQNYQLRSNIVNLINTYRQEFSYDFLALSKLSALNSVISEIDIEERPGKAYVQLTQALEELKNFREAMSSQYSMKKIKSLIEQIESLTPEVSKIDKPMGEYLSNLIDFAKTSIKESQEKSVLMLLEQKLGSALRNIENLITTLADDTFQGIEETRNICPKLVDEKINTDLLKQEILTLAANQDLKGLLILRNKLKKESLVISANLEKQLLEHAEKTLTTELVSIGIENSTYHQLTITAELPCDYYGNLTIKLTKKVDNITSISFISPKEGLNSETISWSVDNIKVSQKTELVIQTPEYSILKGIVEITTPYDLEQYTLYINADAEAIVSCELNECSINHGTIKLRNKLANGKNIVTFSYIVKNPYSVIIDALKEQPKNEYRERNYTLIFEKIRVPIIEYAFEDSPSIVSREIIPLSGVKKFTTSGKQFSRLYFEPFSSSATFSVRELVKSSEVSASLSNIAELNEVISTEDIVPAKKNQNWLDEFKRYVFSLDINYSNSFLKKLDSLSQKKESDLENEFAKIRLEWLNEIRKNLKKDFPELTHVISNYSITDYNKEDMKQIIEKYSEMKQEKKLKDSDITKQIFEIKTSLRNLSVLLEEMHKEYSKGASEKSLSGIFFIKNSDYLKLKEQLNKALAQECTGNKCLEEYRLLEQKATLIADSMNRSLLNAKQAAETNIAYAKSFNVNDQAMQKKLKEKIAEIEGKLSNGNIVDSLILSEKLIASLSKIRSDRNDGKDIVIGLAIIGVILVLVVATYKKQKKAQQQVRKI